jgi:putative photosynthetic complex assembly protein
MSPDRRFPKGALFGAGLLVTVAIVGASAASVGGIGVARIADTAPVTVRDLRFEDRPDGSVAVISAATNREVDVIAPGNHGFVRIVLRGLARDRIRQAQDRYSPFRLTRWQDGRLSVEDPMTGKRVDLGAFGSVNAGAFARLMTAD